jgi:hypothetical protein
VPDAQVALRAELNTRGIADFEALSRARYAAMTNDQLIRLYTKLNALLPEARIALHAELATRGIADSEAESSATLHIDAIRRQYAQMRDDQLLRLYAEIDDLESEAQVALRAQLTARGISEAEADSEAVLHSEQIEDQKTRLGRFEQLVMWCSRVCTRVFLRTRE